MLSRKSYSLAALLAGGSLLHFVSAHAQSQQGEERKQSASASTEPLRFNIFEYRVLGNTTLPVRLVEQSLYGLLGADKTAEDVELARQALEAVYKDAGYGTVFVDIPEQNTDEGIVRLQVVEGRLDRVRITGTRYFSNREIRAAVPALTSGAVPRLPDVQSQLSDLNRITADRAVVPVLKAGRTPGTVDVELKVSDKLPLHGDLEVNDRYTANTSHLRANTSLSYDNLFQRQHRLSFQYQTAPQARNDVEAYVATYVARVPVWATTFAIYGVDSKTDVAALGALSVIGNGTILGLRAIRELPATEGISSNITLGLDYKDFLESIRIDADQSLNTPIRYLNWSAGYSGSSSGEHSSTGYNLTANFGVRGVVNDTVEFQDKRFQGASNYFYLRGGLQQALSLPLSLNLSGKVTGQFTDDPLVSNEQLAIGGADSVRGYLESSQLGDVGVISTIELRSLSLSKLLRSQSGGSYLFAFYDAGIVKLLEPLPSQIDDARLASWGVGIRVADWYGVSAAFDWARILKSTDKNLAGDSRTHFSFRYSF